MSASVAVYSERPSIVSRLLGSRFVAIATIVVAILVVWYAAAVPLNVNTQLFLDEQANITDRPLGDFILATWAQEKPRLPAPHQVAMEIWNTTVGIVRDSGPDDERTGWDRFNDLVTSPDSLAYHALVTLSSTLLGFLLGTTLGIALAVLVVHVRSLDRSLMPWIVSSQTIPILAIAPMIIVVLAAVGLTGLLPKALISTYLSFFPVTVGMVKGLRSPDPMHLDLMRTYSATRAQVFRKLRWPAALPFLFVSMKIAVAASLVGAIVGELPTGAVAGIGAQLLTGSYYSLTLQLWAALVAGSLLAGMLVGIVGLAQRITLRRMGARTA
jgi:NitT/TauT family transport system permease protein